MERPWPLTGRGEELRRVAASVRPGAAGIVVAGPAGVGKTRLARDALAVPTGRGATVVWAVAAFFNGAAQAALPVFVGERPAAAWFHRGEAKVVFDIDVDIAARVVGHVTFRAAPEVLAQVVRRTGDRHDRRREEGTAP